jgi:hypothetical protein
LIRWDYVLGIVGVLLAIPSLLVPWFSGPPALALAGAIAAIACVGAALVVQRFLNLPAISIQFTTNQLCTAAYVQQRRNGVVETVDNGLRRGPNGLWLELDVRNPKGGHEYTVYWHW